MTDGAGFTELDTPLKSRPRGLTPRSIEEEHRMADITDAMVRYSREGLIIPEEWITEAVELYDRKGV